MCKKIARVKRNLRLDTRMTQIDVILLFDGITLLQGIAEEKEKCNASASANFVQVLCKHFPLFYIVFSKVIPTFARKTLFYAILARFFTIFWLFSGSFWSWGGRGRKFKSCHSDQHFVWNEQKIEPNRKIQARFLFIMLLSIRLYHSENGLVHS